MLTLVAVQFLIYGAAWLVAAIFLRDARRAALLWAGYGLLFGVGVGSLIAQGPPVPGLTPAVAAMLLCSYTLAVAGIDQFVNRRAAHLRLWVVLCLAGCACTMAAALWQWPWWIAHAAYNICTAVLLGAPLVLLYKRFVAEFGLWAWLATLTPGAMCLLISARAVQLLSQVQPAQAPTWDAGDRGRLLVSLVAGALFNLSLLGLIIGRWVLQLQRLVDTDALTGALSRRGIERHLLSEWQLSLRHRRPLSIAFVDLDDFKHINDAAGHAVGDQMLAAVAQSLRRHARGADLVGRWGGDEFLVAMPYTDAAGAGQAVRRLQRGVQEIGPTLPQGSPRPSVSVGVVTREPGDKDVDALVARADAAMYSRKQARIRRPALP